MMSRTYLIFKIWCKIMSSSRDALLKLPKRTSPQKLFLSDRITLYIILVRTSYISFTVYRDLLQIWINNWLVIISTKLILGAWTGENYLPFRINRYKELRIFGALQLERKKKKKKNTNQVACSVVALKRDFLILFILVS